MMSENKNDLKRKHEELTENVSKIKKLGTAKYYGLILIAGMMIGLASEIKYKIGYSVGVLDHTNSMIDLMDTTIERR